MMIKELKFKYVVSVSFFVFACLYVFAIKVEADTVSSRLAGRILLQVEQNGEAWYVNPSDMKRTFLGKPSDAFRVMRNFGVGVTNSDLSKIEIGKKENLLFNFSNYNNGNLGFDLYFAKRHAGKIFLQVEQNGEAWYVNPVDFKRYYLGRPQDAFGVMRSFGLGITDKDLNSICVSGGVCDLGVVSVFNTVLHEVPFTSQAPFGGWNDQRQEDGCEEAAVFMAMKWVNGGGLTAQEALAEILAISDFEKEKYGTYNDTSVADTVQRIFKDYYNYGNVEVKYDIISDDIKKALSDGNLVIVPINGQELGNPYFTQPGPERHMILIKGWDAESGEFITNEPGTKRGENYRYKEDVIMRSIRDYATGFHQPIIGEVKAMIEVKKQ